MIPVDLLIVDDDRTAADGLKRALKESPYRVSVCETLEEALSLIKKRSFDVVVCDLKLGDQNGLEVLRELKKNEVDSEFIIMTAFGTIPSAVEALKEGAVDYLTKPIDINHFRNYLNTITERRRLRRENLLLRRQLSERFELDRIVVGSESLKSILRMVRQVAPSRATILISGESGTGKERIARYIHSIGPHPDGPFVSFNCGAFPPGLVESELFGHEKGAFTGAYRTHKGYFELADGGTLFLDEVGELPPTAQVDFLRVLEQSSIHRVGGEKTVPIDVRIIAATNSDLEAAVGKGTFRRDLFYRLNVVAIHIPPLRERPGDIPLLVKAYLDLFCDFYKKPAKELEPGVMDALTVYSWPGNVRELRNCLERTVLMTSGPKISKTDLPEQIVGRQRPEGVVTFPAGVSLVEAERRLIAMTLDKVNGNREKAAKLLGISPRGLRYKIKRFGL